MTSETYGSGAAAGCPVHRDRAPLHGPEYTADPRRVYDALRKQGPVARVEVAPGIPAALVVSYDAALDVLRDPKTFPRDPRRWQRTAPQDSPVAQFMMYRPSCVKADGEVHARLRTAISDSVARVDLYALRESVERHAESLIRRFSSRGSADLRTDYALVLPLLVLNEVLGCPTPLSDRMVSGMRGYVDNVDTAESTDTVLRAIGELVALKHARPADDLTSWLLDHPARLSDEEVIEQIFMLVGLGTEPEQNLIANALRLLLSDERFAGDLSGGSLPVEDALDEVLWSDPPIANWAISYPVQDVVLRGVPLPADQPVVVGFAAANTDPATAATNRTGNRAHLAWGAGPHTCPVQGQARMIASVAVEKLLDTLPDMELSIPADRLEWRPGFWQRALVSLPVRFTPLHIPPPPKPGGQEMGLAGGLAEALRNAGPRRGNVLARWWRGE